jgi:hypothetical protein
MIPKSDFLELKEGVQYLHDLIRVDSQPDYTDFFKCYLYGKPSFYPALVLVDLLTGEIYNFECKNSGDLEILLRMLHYHVTKDYLDYLWMNLN